MDAQQDKYKIEGVPSLKQNNPYLCCPVACSMMMKFKGKTFVWPNQWDPVNEYDGFYLTNPNNRIVLTNEFYYLAQANNLLVLVSEKYYTSDDLITLLKKYGPIVASVDYSQFMMGAKGHCITITGINKDGNVIHNCPSFGKDQVINFSRILNHCDGFLAVCSENQVPGSKVLFP